MTNPFYKTSLVYKLCTYIQHARSRLLEDLVAYTKDPVRYKRRMRMLIQLSNYEHDILKKIQDFETNNIADLDNNMLIILKQEVDVIVDISS